MQSYQKLWGSVVNELWWGVSVLTGPTDNPWPLLHLSLISIHLLSPPLSLPLPSILCGPENDLQGWPLHLEQSPPEDQLLFEAQMDGYVAVSPT